MKPGSGYFPVESSSPFKGLATSFPSTKIDPGFSPNLNNVVIRDGVVSRRAGGSQLGQQLVGAVMAMTNFGELGETPSLVVFTTRRQYYYDTGTNKFVDITDGQVSYAVTAITTTYFEIAGDHTADFTIGESFPVDTGVNEGVYEVVSIALVAGNTQLVTTPAPPTLTVSGNIIVADELTGTDADLISFARVTDITSHRLLMTNGFDPVLVWNGTTSGVFEDWAPTITSIADFVTCKVLAVFSEHLFLGGIVHSASEEPLTIAWSDAGDFDNFDDGDAGAQILYQLISGIKAMEILGDRLAIYSNETLMTSFYVGAPAIFLFEVVIPDGIRLAGAHGISSLNVGHVYASEENIYIFDGTRGLRTLGDNIYTDYKQRKDFQHLYRLSVLNDYAKRTLFFAVPSYGTVTIVYTALYDVFNLANTVWSKEQYYDNVRAWGFFVNVEETILWEDAAWETVDSPWSSELGIWGAESEQLGFPIRVYGTDEGRVVLVTEGMLTDRGNSVQQLYDTKDFEALEVNANQSITGGSQSVLGRWGEIEFEAFGSAVNVSYSVDKGASWRSYGEVALVGDAVSYRLPIDIVGRTLRVRFEHTTGVWTLRNVRAWCKPGEPR